MATQAEQHAAAKAIAGTHRVHIDSRPMRLIRRQAKLALEAAERARVDHTGD